MHSPAMPTVSAIFSGPVSVGLLAGVVSGLFYLVVAGIRWAGEVKQQSGEWLYRQVQRRLNPAPSAGTLCIADNGVGMEPETVRVREFIERLVESLVSGELDNVCIKRLHSHPEYKHMAAYDSPSAAHAALKQLVHQIIQEAMSLPKFKGVRPTEDDMKSLEDMESKTYEDILATAILNKVIERYQHRDSSGRAAVDGNSNLLSPELMSLVAMHQPLHHHYSESGGNPRRNTDDGDSMSELSNTDPLSVTIEECIEEVTFSNTEDDADEDDSYLPGPDIFKTRRAPFPEYGRDIIDGPPLDAYESEEDEELPSEDESSMQPTDVINPVDSWEENWLFQKRRLKVGGVAQPMPVPMLVPNPSEDYRALIGDRDAEDVSDLSDCSDGALEDVVLAEDNTTSDSAPVTTLASAANIENKIAVNSVGSDQITPSMNMEKPVKNIEVTSVNGHLDKEIMPGDDNKQPTYDIRELTEAKNMEYLKSADDCLSEFGQQEGEYTEDYAAVTQRQLDSLTAMSDPDSSDIPELPSSPIPQLRPETSTVDASVVAILDDLVPGESDTDHPETSSLANADLAKPPRPGTIAEREHKKWETAQPLPNNPYSPENIIKRLSKKQPHNQTNNNGNSSMEHSEANGTIITEKVVEEPLQVICSPTDVDYKRYGRDYYINAQPVANSVKTQLDISSPQQQVSDATFISVAKLEKQILNRDVYHSSFRARNASPHFTMNPLYETEKENIQTDDTETKSFSVNSSTQEEECPNDSVLPEPYDHYDIQTNSLCNSSSVQVFDRFQSNPLFKPPQEGQLNLQIDNSFLSEVKDNDSIERLHRKLSAENRFPADQIGIKNIRDNVKRENVCSESGYSSSLDSLNDPSAYLLRLTPPSQPQMVEKTFESLTSLRRSGSLRVVRKRKQMSSPFMGGSLRIYKRRNTPVNELW